MPPKRLTYSTPTCDHAHSTLLAAVVCATTRGEERVARTDGRSWHVSGREVRDEHGAVTLVLDDLSAIAPQRAIIQ